MTNEAEDKQTDELNVIAGIRRWLARARPDRRRAILEYVLGAQPKMVLGAQVDVFGAPPQQGNGQ